MRDAPLCCHCREPVDLGGATAPAGAIVLHVQCGRKTHREAVRRLRAGLVPNARPAAATRKPPRPRYGTSEYHRSGTRWVVVGVSLRGDRVMLSKSYGTHELARRHALALAGCEDYASIRVEPEYHGA